MTLAGKLLRSRLVIPGLPECLAPSAAVKLTFSACADNWAMPATAQTQSDSDKLWTVRDQTREKRLPGRLDNRKICILSRERGLLPGQHSTGLLSSSGAPALDTTLTLYVLRVAFIGRGCWPAVC